MSGACVAPATTAAMPTSAYAAGEPPSGSRPIVWSATPKAAPVAAPRNSDGAKTPPEPPEPSVRQVARALQASRTRSMTTVVVTGS